MSSGLSCDQVAIVANQTDMSSFELERPLVRLSEVTCHGSGGGP